MELVTKLRNSGRAASMANPPHSILKPTLSSLSLDKDKNECHFEVKFNYNLETHCSKIDESFIDYLLDSENNNFVIYFD